MKQSFARVLNYVVAGLVVLGMVMCWLQYRQSKEELDSPLIPRSLTDVYYKPAIVSTVFLSLVLLLQVLSLHFKKGNNSAACIGLVLVVALWVLYPYLVSSFL